MKAFSILILTALTLCAASPTREYPCKVTACHDADTFDVVLSIGFDLFKADSVRLAGLDTPELSTPQGKAARDVISKMVLGKEGTLILTLDKKGNPKREKYGRLLGVLIVGATNINALILDQKIGRPYSGGKKEAWGPADEVPGP